MLCMFGAIASADGDVLVVCTEDNPFVPRHSLPEQALRSLLMMPSTRLSPLGLMVSLSL